MIKSMLLKNDTAVQITIGLLIAVCIGIVSMLIAFIGFWPFMYALLCGVCISFLIMIMLILSADLERARAKDSPMMDRNDFS